MFIKNFTIWTALVILSLLPLFLTLDFAQAGPILSGFVLDAIDTTSPNGSVVTMFHDHDLDDNLTDVVGGGGFPNEYLMDCRNFDVRCKKGDLVNITIFLNDTNKYYTAGPTNITVGTGCCNNFTNMTLNSPPNTSVVVVDDTAFFPVNELDLLAGANLTVFCNATLADADGWEGIDSASAILYDNISSSSSGSDAMATHYTNNTCFLFDGVVGGGARRAECAFAVAYYSNNATWTCNITVSDNHSIVNSSVDYTSINKLIALNIPSSIDFGTLSPGAISFVNKTNITNFGNVEIDIKIYGYSNNQTNSSAAFNCTTSGGIKSNITLDRLHYNVTDTTGAQCTNFGWGSNSFNLTNQSNEKSWTNFNLGKQNVEGDLMNNYTCWVLRIPAIGEENINPAGVCTGVISFIASES